MKNLLLAASFVLVALISANSAVAQRVEIALGDGNSPAPTKFAAHLGATLIASVEVGQKINAIEAGLAPNEYIWHIEYTYNWSDPVQLSNGNWSIWCDIHATVIIQNTGTPPPPELPADF